MSNIITAPPPTPQQVAERERQNITNVRTSFGSGDYFKYDPNYHRMADFLGLSEENKNDLTIAQKVSFLRDFTGEKTEVDAMVRIKGIIRELGLPMKGKELLDELYKYTRLAQERDSVNKKITEHKKEMLRAQLEEEKAMLDKEMTLHTKTSPKEEELKVEKITRIDPSKIKTKLKDQLTEYSKFVKSSTKRTVTRSINKGINEAIGDIVKKFIQ